jgi:hypothetical protein
LVVSKLKNYNDVHIITWCEHNFNYVGFDSPKALKQYIIIIMCYIIVIMHYITVIAQELLSKITDR